VTIDIFTVNATNKKPGFTCLESKTIPETGIFCSAGTSQTIPLAKLPAIEKVVSP
jgi:hypothetical protein